ncbi:MULTISPECIES: TorF family putative porin [unclassified Brevundimonas]|uniref:TorF family putative porin n=1 Tax=unclassified Brevundimonas TaxID=2622653 RepID=UPI0025BB4B0C|nr:MULTISPECIES: TorF family putative porin [unclassified Brevundimonas]
MRLFVAPFSIAVVALAPVVPSVAEAQSFSGELGVASQYIGKGLGKSDGDIAPFAKVEGALGQAYASVFVSDAAGAQGYDMEIVSTLGWRPKAAGFAFDLGVLNRDLPGSRAGVDADYWEYQADAARKLGPVATRLRVNYSPDGFAATRAAWWLELQGAVAVSAATKVSAAVANRMADGGVDYNAWNLGAKHRLTDAVALDLRWYDTDRHSAGEPYEGRLVASAAYSF